jgi:hypothetical protein
LRVVSELLIANGCGAAPESHSSMRACRGDVAESSLEQMTSCEGPSTETNGALLPSRAAAGISKVQAQ